MHPPPGSGVYRVRPIGRVVSLLLVAVWVGLSTIVTVGGGVSLGVPVILWVTTALVCLGVWRWAFVPYVALTDTGVEIQNRITRRQVPYAEIVGATVGYGGLTIARRDGSSVTAWAVQKSNGARWTHRNTRGDEIVAAVLKHSASYSAGSTAA